MQYALCIVSYSTCMPIKFKNVLRIRYNYVDAGIVENYTVYSICIDHHNVTFTALKSSDWEFVKS